jgi:P-type conjugative transfer protein TrbJ
MKRVFASLFAVLIVVASATVVRGAGIPVVDPVNLVENASIAVSDASNVVQQVKTVQKQIQMLKKMKKNLKKLRVGDLQQMERSFRDLKRMYRQGRQISTEWGSIADDFEETYSGYSGGDGGEKYREKRREWEKQTDEAIKSAMRSHGVISEQKDREESLKKLINASSQAEGALQALQAGNRISGVLVKQLQELTSIIAADSRAKLSYLKEKHEKQKAQREMSEYQLMEGYGERGDYEQPSDEWPSFKE